MAAGVADYKWSILAVDTVAVLHALNIDQHRSSLTTGEQYYAGKWQVLIQNGSGNILRCQQVTRMLMLAVDQCKSSRAGTYFLCS